MIRSSRAGLRFHRSLIQLQHGRRPDHTASDLTITFHSKQKYQKILGFGSAFTDASGIAAKSLGTQMTQLIIDNLFSERGLQYSMARIPIAGTDFSTRKYTYDDNNAGDFALERFSLQPEDSEYKVMIHNRSH